MWKNRVLYLLLLLGVVIFFIDHNGWVSRYMLAMVLILPAVSLLCSLPLVRHRRIRISESVVFPRKQQNSITVSLKTGKSGIVPVCRVFVEITDKLEGKTARERVFLNPKHTVSVPCDHCGVYEYRVVKGYVYDFLGLFRFPVKLPGGCTAVVEPVGAEPARHPDFTGFRSKSFKPKAGGGFSEIHEIREYRPGDPLKNIHWKLSAKTDDLMIRDPQEPQTRPVQVTVDLTDDRERLDTVLDELCWVSQQLLKMEIPHDICYPAGEECRILSVKSEKDLHEVFRDIMSRPVKSGASVMSGGRCPYADWRYHIDPYRKGDADEKT
ncbi:MAG: DUF58 domain-containing protein [Ruminococcaceae bacterium]|nr:DUF58 domain-containing protein [Oscillospiraceae bacterium]